VEAINTFDVSLDGRFLMTSLTQQAANPISVVVNWQPALDNDTGERRESSASHECRKVSESARASSREF
jgi:hypothetical protein